MNPQRKKVIARDRNHLRQLVYESIQKNGPNCDLNFIDVSNVEDMEGVFAGANSIFNGDISQWDVSCVETMSNMFHGSQFNGDISRWNVSSVVSMWGMFAHSQFNGDVSRWNVSDVWELTDMFAYSKFAGDVSGWNIADDALCIGMFNGSLLDERNLIPGWYKDREEKIRNGNEFFEVKENSVDEEEFNLKNDEEMDNIPF